jgi:hypothetical protein
MANTTRISEIRNNITSTTDLTKEEALEQMLDYLSKSYPKIKVSDKKPLNSTIPDEIANEVYKAVTGKMNAAVDFRERLYLFFKGGGSLRHLPVDLEPHSNGFLVPIYINGFGIVDLGAYKKRLDCKKHTLQEYAAYLVKYQGAVEITEEEAMKKLKEGAIIPREVSPIPGIDLTQTDKNPVELNSMPLLGDDEQKEG